MAARKRLLAELAGAGGGVLAELTNFSPGCSGAGQGASSLCFDDELVLAFGE
jgi:hypothetical protein